MNCRCVLAILLSVFLSGCGNAADTNDIELTPNTIKLDNEIVSYSDTEIPDAFWDAGVDFKVNDDNEIRCITIEGTDVETYKNISVGDPINKVKASFDYEYGTGSFLSVLFDGDTEIEVSQDKPLENPSDDFLWLTYCEEDGVINKIMIYDYKYGNMMK